MAWIADRHDCGGVLSPDIDGLRVLYNVKTKTFIPWQKAAHESGGDVVVGRFSLDPEGFQTAKKWLEEALTDPEIRYIILDEVGQLELEGKGWGPWLLSALDRIGDKTLVIIVRRPLLDEVINYYGLDEVSVVEKDYFTKD
jgi:nucleoside-triphosphatase THEP1